MQHETPAELLQQLLDACNEGNHGATLLAEQTEIEALRSFLQESARQYQRAADDLRAVGHLARYSTSSASDEQVDSNRRPDDVVSAWERAECEALTYFRDAYDVSLPNPIAETVKRHYEAGVNRLERLRELQARLA